MRWFLALSFGLTSAPAAAADLCPGRGTMPAVVATAVDGTTLALADGSTVRLAGVEAPLAPIGRTEEWRLGDAARHRLAELVMGKSVTLAIAGDGPDRYGRKSAYVFADGRLVQLDMVAAGLARARWLPDEAACLAELVAAERAPRAAGRGMWSAPAYRPVAAGDPSLLQRSGLYAIVQGRVTSVGHGYSLVFVDFGHDFRRDFTVLVPQPLAEQMAAEGRPLDALVGKTVEVRGMIEQNGGPAMRLNDSAEIAVVAGR